MISELGLLTARDGADLGVRRAEEHRDELVELHEELGLLDPPHAGVVLVVEREMLDERGYALEDRSGRLQLGRRRTGEDLAVQAQQACLNELVHVVGRLERIGG